MALLKSRAGSLRMQNYYGFTEPDIDIQKENCTEKNASVLRIQEVSCFLLLFLFVKPGFLYKSVSSYLG